MKKILYKLINISNTLIYIMLIIWSLNLRDPHLLSIRDIEIHIISSLIGLITIFIFLLNGKLVKYISLTFSLMIIANIVIEDNQFKKYKYEILTNPTQQHRNINKRLIIGFSDVNEIKTLSLNGIAGIFISQRNIKNKSFNEIKDFLSKLQHERIIAGYQPLIITTDQEGGPVSRLSPLIKQKGSLQQLASDSQYHKKSFNYGFQQGQLLRDIGVNVNFSPVVDLKSSNSIQKLDFHSRINTRAISDSENKVINVALPYIKGLERSGVTATLKHFPGLGSVTSDTHHFSAHLDLQETELMSKDWLPFIQLTKQTNSWIMLSHVILDNIDKKNPVSTSKIVVNDLIRTKLGFTGKLVTDDLTMGATYNRGFCKSVIGAYSADINYLLISYDHEKYYDLINCLDRNINLID